MFKHWIVVKAPATYQVRHNQPGQSKPYKKHTSFISASTEATRLAATFPGETFVVMEAIESYKTDVGVFRTPL